MASGGNARKKIRIKYFRDQANHLPLIHIILCHNGVYLPTPALVDSGAQITLIPKTMACILGIKQTKKIDSVGGAGGRFKVYTCNMDRIILMKDNTVLNEITRPRIRVPLDYEMPFVVLGRDTIFKKYKILFEENDKQLWLIGY